MAEISLAEYARIRDLSRNAVVRAIENGRLKNSIRVEQRKGTRDKIWITDIALANREWEMNTSAKHKPKTLGDDAITLAAATPTPTGKAPARKAGTSKPQAFAPTEPIDPSTFDDPNQIDPSTGVPRVMVSRARKEHFDAVHAQAKAELLAGTQVNREEVTRAAFNVAREVRDALFLIKDRLADELATMNDPNQISTYLDTEFRNALTKLAGEIVLERPDVG